ncbi:hybrid sensor histidine kinase/response regulator [Mannheimia granulomatis]|uniref:Aerobic respiration control sensor protein n=1 Tax=Mannheimia granulomatis TaxID=85402 RepID=A0A6G8JI14_9PAST|nr:ATP-binding protein [Mannheimia granulomatis]QIM66825.1 hybrid sensor histidine kinase/response regulator [Mannheimia granulomatis]
MQVKKFSQKYVNWVLRLGRLKATILGFFVVAISAILIQSALTYLFIGQIVVMDILRSIAFGLISAPFVLYFFTLLVEKLERSRLKLEKVVLDLEELREQDAYLNAKLEKNNRDKTILMATISHELRTPLNGIIGLSQILLDDEPNEKQHEYLKTINMSATALAHIFGDIIDLEKIDSSRIELFRKEVEFQQLINDIANFAEFMAGEKNIHFELNYPPNLPKYIYIDHARLNQILWNLISNAVKFTSTSGRISLEICQLGNEQFSFSLTDSGIGIPEKDQRKIFDMFYQAENSKEKKAQGSGIGLSVAKRIAKLMGGDLVVASKEHQGSTFTLTVHADSAETKPTLEIQNHALKVLLVEDIEMNVVIARVMLQKFGCDVDVAMSGEEAFELFEQHSYDLILLDIQLPDISGFEIAQTLRNRYENEEIDYLPILIALTANVIQTKKDYRMQGMDDVLRKPLSLEELANCLNHYFDHSFMQDSDEKRPLVSDENPNLCYSTRILKELIEVMGKEAVLANMELFANLMPTYQENLRRYIADWKMAPSAEYRKLAAEEAHKIKGALASVGLHKLQQVAQLAQNDNGDMWEAHIEKWAEQIYAQWQADLQEAKEFVSSH